MSFGQVFSIRFVLYLPEWESGDKNLCTCGTLVQNSNHNPLTLSHTPFLQKDLFLKRTLESEKNMNSLNVEYI